MAKKNKSSPKKSRGRSRARSSRRTPPSSYFGSQVQAPTHFGFVNPRQPQRMHEIHDPSLGPGIVVTGSEFLAHVRVAGTGAAAGSPFTPTTGTANSVSSVQMGAFGATVTGSGLFNAGLLSKISIGFGFYRYKSAILRYIPTCATTTAAQLVFTVVEDTSLLQYGLATPTWAALVSAPHSFETVAWGPASYGPFKFAQTRPCWYVDAGGNTTAQAREHFQWAIIGQCDSSTDGVIYGKLFMDYEIEFFARGSLVTAAPEITAPVPSNDISARPRYNSVDIISIDDQKVAAVTAGGTAAFPMNVVGVNESGSFTSIPIDVKRVASQDVPTQIGAQTLLAGTLPIDVSRFEGKSSLNNPLRVQGTTSVNGTACVPVCGAELEGAHALSVVAPEGAYFDVTPHGGAMPITNDGSTTINVTVVADNSDQVLVEPPPPPEPAPAVRTPVKQGAGAAAPSFVRSTVERLSQIPSAALPTRRS